jgi:hypothetical protein
MADIENRRRALVADGAAIADLASLTAELG